MRALLFAVLAATGLALAAWLLLRPAVDGAALAPDAGLPTPTPEVTAAPGATPTTTSAPAAAPRTLEGHVTDEAEQPVPGATVQAFPRLRAWFNHDHADECGLSLLACDTIAAADEVLARLRAGTLAYPEPLASTVTDATGRFALTGNFDGALLVVTSGGVQDTDSIPEEGPVSVTLPRVAPPRRTLAVTRADAPAAGVEVTIVNPFTREVQVSRTDEAGLVELAVPGRLWWAAAAAEGDATALRVPNDDRPLVLTRPRSLQVSLRAAGQPIDGTVRVDCGGPPLEAETRDAGATFADVPAVECAVSATAPGLDGPRQTVELAGGRTAVTVSLLPVARLSLTLVDAASGEPLALAEVSGHGPLARRPWRLLLRDGARGELEGLLPGPYTVTVRAKGYLREQRELTLRPGLNEVELGLLAAHVARGRVVDERGAPVEGALVIARQDGRNDAQAASDADGGFTLELDAPGAWQLAGTMSWVGVGTTSTTVPGPPATLRLAPERVLELTVTAPGHALDEEAVIVLLTPDEKDPSPRRSSGRGVPLRDGGIREADLEAGGYELSVVAPGLARVTRAFTMPERGTVALTVALDEGASVGGVVVSPSGRPVPGAEVRLGPDGFTTTDERGRFQVGALPPGPVQLEVEAPTEDLFTSQAITAPAKDLRVVLSPRPRWKGRVVDAKGQPVGRFVANGKALVTRDGRFDDVPGQELCIEALGEKTYEYGAPRDVGDVVVLVSKKVKGRVVLPTGEPAVRASVQFADYGRPLTLADGDGRFELKLSSRTDELPGLVALHPGGYARFTPVAGQDNQVVLSPMLHVNGRVVNGRGEGRSATVTARGLTLAYAVSRAAGHDGHFTADLPPGPWAFIVRDVGATLANLERDGQEVRLDTSRGDCSLELWGRPNHETTQVTLSSGDGRERFALQFSHFDAVPVPCGAWRVDVDLGGGRLASRVVDLKPPGATLAVEASRCANKPGCLPFDAPP